MTRFFYFSSIVLLAFFGLSVHKPLNFLEDQLRFERVRNASLEKESKLKTSLLTNGLTLSDLNVIFVAYKASDLLEIYGKSKTETKYKKIMSYPICARSGVLGPKRKMGDYQVPEGFYHIDRFNPTSSYYLSLGINYPNLSDKRKSTFSNLGGDIFIHGSCVTIGCLPMSDDAIKEIYLLAVHARNNGQTTIPVYVFPFEMSNQHWKTYQLMYSDQLALLNFWKNLKEGYDQFQYEKKVLKFSISTNGDYIF